MAYTPQQSALATVQNLFGDTGWTEDHVNYRRVGFWKGRMFSAIGETWGEAIELLKAKVAR